MARFDKAVRISVDQRSIFKGVIMGLRRTTADENKPVADSQ